MPPARHLQDELLELGDRPTVQTRYGTIKGLRAANGAIVFLNWYRLN